MQTAAFSDIKQVEILLRRQDGMLVILALPIKEQLIAAQSTSGLCLSCL